MRLKSPVLGGPDRVSSSETGRGRSGIRGKKRQKNRQKVFEFIRRKVRGDRQLEKKADLLQPYHGRCGDRISWAIRKSLEGLIRPQVE